ncbi:kininogen-1 [Brachionichthys hirsutus]|uniref:kininogen-1 n=1 Tax=Brachionichthys hirsutus TaxID=412623 RepID=UPI0036048B58
MRSGLRLCVLGLLCLHSSAFGQTSQPPGVLMFCDDPSVTEAVSGAVSKFNERMSSGNKLALFQVQTASKMRIDSESVYSLQFSSRRSDCPAGGSKPWTDCDYLPVNRKPFSCSAKVYMMENGTDAREVDCLLDDVIIPGRASCLGCPEDIDRESDDLKTPLSAALGHYNSISNSSHLFTLNSVGHATRQVMAGFRYKLRFDMRKTVCAKAEHKDLNDQCVPDEENMEYAHCNSTVDVAPWRLVAPDVEVNCNAGALPPTLSVFSRFRLPPGWSPLRNAVYEPPSSSASTPTTASAAEESSEEDAAAADSPDSPFHCPSKPWKPFNPPTAASPAEGAVGATSTPSSADAGFSDLDLVG